MSTAPMSTRVESPQRAPAFRERFGGVDTPAAVMGMFSALGVLVFVGALIGAGANELDYQLNVIDVEGNVQELLTAGAILAIVAVFVSFFLGGWAAARMARYDGPINGLAAAMWMLLLVAALAALGAWADEDLNALQIAGLPDWFSQIRGDDVTTAAISAGIAAAAATLLGGMLGGLAGERYHRQADAALVADATLVAGAITSDDADTAVADAD
jgi:hypothetical protein